MPGSHDPPLAFAHVLLCAAAVAQAERGRDALRRAASPAAARALERLAAAPEGQRLARFVEQRRNELCAAVAGTGAVEARERTGIWSHAVAGEALDRAQVARADRWDGWSLEVRQGRAVFVHPRADLSAREFALLRALTRNAGITLTREQLLEHAWPDDVGITANSVDVYVGYLRRKLGAGVVRTVHGTGYRVEPEVAEALAAQARGR
jgi:DNA-binding response OmpR family regulator